MDRLRGYVAAHPRATAIWVLVTDALITVLGALVTGALWPDWSGLARSLVVAAVLAALTVGFTVALGGFRYVGLGPAATWRRRALLWVPLLLALLPLAAGVRPLETGTVVLLLVGYLLTGFYEELLWRGAVLTVLRPTGLLTAAVLSSVLFGAAHLTNVLFRESVALVAAQAFGAACFGFGYAAIRLRTGASLLPLMVAHFATDLVAKLTALPAIPVLVAQDVILLVVGVLVLRAAATGRDRAGTPAVDRAVARE